MSYRLLLGLLVATAACNGTEPAQYGSMDSRIVEGAFHTVTAGHKPGASLGLVYRNPLTGALRYDRAPLWERILLPPVAHALQAIGFVGVPNATYCVHKDQSIVVALKDCITTDALGNSRWDFVAPTKAGVHEVHVSATLGSESTIPDTIVFTVNPGEANPDYETGTLPSACSPAALPATAVQDQYGNAIPYRIVPDGRLAVGSDTVGAASARTVTFDSTTSTPTAQFYPLELRDSSGTQVGKVRYKIAPKATAICVSGAEITWLAGGMNTTP